MNRLPGILFFSLLCFTACKNDLATVNKIASKKEVEVDEGDTIEIIYSSDAHVKAKLKAPHALVYNTLDPYEEFDRGLIVYFYNDSMKQISQLTAGYGRTFEKKEQMLVRNNVEVFNIHNEKLNCEELVWDNKTRKVRSDKFVKIQTKDEIIYGDGLEANEDLTNYKIKKIRGTINLKNNPLK